MEQYNSDNSCTKDPVLALFTKWTMFRSGLHKIVDSAVLPGESDALLGTHRLPINAANMAIINCLDTNSRFISARFTAEIKNNLKVISFYPNEAINGVAVHDVGIRGDNITELSDQPAAGVALYFTRSKLGAAFLDSEGNPFQSATRLTATGLALAALPKALA